MDTGQRLIQKQLHRAIPPDRPGKSPQRHRTNRQRNRQPCGDVGHQVGYTGKATADAKAHQNQHDLHDDPNHQRKPGIRALPVNQVARPVLWTQDDQPQQKDSDENGNHRQTRTAESGKQGSDVK